MKKNPILISNIVRGKKRTDKVVIGIVGTHTGVGVTHTGIMLSNYLSEHKSVKTAYLEMNEEDDFKHLLYAYERCTEETMEQNHFHINHTTYYKNVRDSELVTIFNEDFEYLILDFGTEFNKNRSEFLRCDIKLVIGSLTEWKRHELFEFVEENSEMPGFVHWKYLIVFGQKRDLRIASHELHTKLEWIGFEPDPYVLSKESIKVFQKIIFPS